jgi:cellobiose-specific phosphotransferase system component IIB
MESTEEAPLNIERALLCCRGGVSSSFEKVKEVERKNFKPKYLKKSSEARFDHVPIHEIDFSGPR